MTVKMTWTERSSSKDFFYRAMRSESHRPFFTVPGTAVWTRGSAAACPAAAATWWWRKPSVPTPEGPTAVSPKVVGASHHVSGYEPERAADGKEHTFWLVPGGQRMEMMSRDKWLVFDLGAERSVSGLSLLGLVDSFAPVRMMLETARSQNGPWRRVRWHSCVLCPLVRDVKR